MSLYVLKPKTENINITQDYMIETGKKCKSSLQAQKKSTIKIKILYVSFQGNL